MINSIARSSAACAAFNSHFSLHCKFNSQLLVIDHSVVHKSKRKTYLGKEKLDSRLKGRESGFRCAGKTG